MSAERFRSYLAQRRQDCEEAIKRAIEDGWSLESIIRLANIWAEGQWECGCHVRIVIRADTFEPISGPYQVMWWPCAVHDPDGLTDETDEYAPPPVGAYPPLPPKDATWDIYVPRGYHVS